MDAQPCRMSFATFVEKYRELLDRPKHAPPNADAVRFRELVRRATDTVARQHHGHHNPHQDRITVHPTTEQTQQ